MTHNRSVAGSFKPMSTPFAGRPWTAVFAALGADINTLMAEVI